MIARVKAVASINGKVAAEAELVMGRQLSVVAKASAELADIYLTGHRAPNAQIGAGR